MVITNLEQKENRKIWVPIRGGNRGGWSLFDWQKVREMPYRDRQMYLGNSAKIGVLDKGGKWRKKDWYLKQNHLEGEELEQRRSQAMKKDQERMNSALGISPEEDQEQLTPAEMQILLRRIRGAKEEGAPQANASAIGLGFDKTKVEIRAKPSTKVDNPHRLEGTYQDEVKEERQSSEQRRQHRRQKKQKEQKKQKKDKKQKRERERSRDRSRQRGSKKSSKKHKRHDSD